MCAKRYFGLLTALFLLPWGSRPGACADPLVVYSAKKYHSDGDALRFAQDEIFRLFKLWSFFPGGDVRAAVKGFRELPVNDQLLFYSLLSTPRPGEQYGNWYEQCKTFFTDSRAEWLCELVRAVIAGRDMPPDLADLYWQETIRFLKEHIEAGKHSEKFLSGVMSGLPFFRQSLASGKKTYGELLRIFPQLRSERLRVMMYPILGCAWTTYAPEYGAEEDGIRAIDKILIEDRNVYIALEHLTCLIRSEGHKELMSKVVSVYERLRRQTGDESYDRFGGSKIRRDCVPELPEGLSNAEVRTWLEENIDALEYSKSEGNYRIKIKEE